MAMYKSSHIFLECNQDESDENLKTWRDLAQITFQAVQSELDQEENVKSIEVDPSLYIVKKYLHCSLNSKVLCILE